MEKVPILHDSFRVEIELYKLLYYSEVAKAMYGDKFKKEQISEIDLSHNSKESFDIFIDFLDTGDIPKITNPKLADELLNIAGELGVNKLHDKLMLKKEPKYYLLEDLVGKKKSDQVQKREIDINSLSIKIPFADCIIFAEEIFNTYSHVYFISDGDILYQVYLDKLDAFPLFIKRQIFRSLSLEFFDKIMAYGVFDFRFYKDQIIENLKYFKNNIYTTSIKINFRALKIYIKTDIDSWDLIINRLINKEIFEYKSDKFKELGLEKEPDTVVLFI